MTTDVSTVVNSHTIDYLPPPDPKAVEQAMLIGDLSQMTDKQRIAYYVAVCRSLHLNALTRPFMALQGDDGKLSLYPDKGCAEQLRKLHRVSIRVISREFLDDLYMVTVEASTPDGRVEEAQGIVPIAKEKGTWEEYDYQGKKRRRFKAAVDSNGQVMMLPLTASERAAAMMRCETKAKRRATLAICGLGLPDWDQEPTSAAHPLALNLQTGALVEDPRVAASPPPLVTPAEQAKDVTQHVADLYGDGTSPQSLAAAYIPRIEAVILAHPGADVAAWNTWAERRFRKSMEAFSEDDWRTYLEHVERLASEKQAGMPSGARTGHEEEKTAAQHLPSSEGRITAPEGSETLPGTEGPSWGPESPDLFAQEEYDATEYGE